MKKVFALLLAAGMCLSLVACGGEGAASGTPGDQNDAPDETQMQFDAFYAEGKQNRTELEFGVTYTIQDGLNMTAAECVLTDNLRTYGLSGPNFKALYLRITLENTSGDGIYIRQDGVYIDGEYWLKWGSDVRANIEVKGFGIASVNINQTPVFSETPNASDYVFKYEGPEDTTEEVKDFGPPSTNINLPFVFNGTLDAPNASNYVFKYEELEDTIPKINFGNHIYLAPGAQGEYYLHITSIDMEQAKQTPIYATITFDNFDFFCDLSALVKAAE